MATLKMLVPGEKIQDLEVEVMDAEGQEMSSRRDQGQDPTGHT